MASETENPGSCALCEGVATKDDYCFGCKEWVCETCCVNYNMPFGGHELEVHTEDPEEDFDE